MTTQYGKRQWTSSRKTNQALKILNSIQDLDLDLTVDLATLDIEF